MIDRTKKNFAVAPWTWHAAGSDGNPRFEDANGRWYRMVYNQTSDQTSIVDDVTGDSVVVYHYDPPQRLSLLEAQVSQLMKDSHPKQPTIPAEEFDSYKEETARRLDFLAERIDELQTQLREES